MGLLNVTIGLLNKYYDATALHIRKIGVSICLKLSLHSTVQLLMLMVVVL